jgi:hypothetical protein
VRRRASEEQERVRKQEISSPSIATGFQARDSAQPSFATGLPMGSARTAITAALTTAAALAAASPAAPTAMHTHNAILAAHTASPATIASELEAWLLQHDLAPLGPLLAPFCTVAALQTGPPSCIA